MLYSEPFISCSSPPSLYFVRDHQAAVAPDDFGNDFKIFSGRRDESTRALDRFCDKRRNLSGSACLDHRLNIMCTGDTAPGIGFSQVTTIAIWIECVHNTVGTAHTTAPQVP